jgi:hypothetical protein
VDHQAQQANQGEHGEVTYPDSVQPEVVGDTAPSGDSDVGGPAHPTPELCAPHISTASETPQPAPKTLLALLLWAARRAAADGASQLRALAALALDLWQQVGFQTSSLAGDGVGACRDWALAQEGALASVWQGAESAAIALSSAVGASVAGVGLADEAVADALAQLPAWSIVLVFLVLGLVLWVVLVRMCSPFANHRLDSGSVIVVIGNAHDVQMLHTKVARTGAQLVLVRESLGAYCVHVPVSLGAHGGDEG